MIDEEGRGGGMEWRLPAFLFNGFDIVLFLECYVRLCLYVGLVGWLVD